MSQTKKSTLRADAPEFNFNPNASEFVPHTFGAPQPAARGYAQPAAGRPTYAGAAPFRGPQQFVPSSGYPPYGVPAYNAPAMQARGAYQKQPVYVPQQQTPSFVPQKAPAPAVIQNKAPQTAPKKEKPAAAVYKKEAPKKQESQPLAPKKETPREEPKKEEPKKEESKKEEPVQEVVQESAKTTEPLFGKEDCDTEACRYSFRFMRYHRELNGEAPDDLDPATHCVLGFNQASQREEHGRRDRKSRSKSPSWRRPKGRGDDGKDRKGRYGQEKPAARGPTSWRAEYIELKPSESGFQIKKVDGSEKVLREVKSILNKLTPEKFKVLLEKLIVLLMDNLEILDELVSIIFNKAVDEPHFANMYAELCRSVCFSLAKRADKLSTQFRRALLHMCQQEFEQEANFNFSQFDDLPEEERAEKILKLRLREQGLVTFIGQLYNCRLLTNTIMVYCISRRLRNTDDPVPEDIESLCKLMTTIGKMFEKYGESAYLKQTFDQLAVMSKNKRLPSRIRFMLQDLIELRGLKWRPRRVVAQAKTMKEIHKEASRPKFEKKIRRAKEERPSRPSRRDADEWTSVPKKLATRGSGAGSDVRGTRPKLFGRKSETKAEPETRSNGFDALSADTTPKKAAAPRLSEEEAITKIKATIKEFLNLNDSKEAKLCIEELQAKPLLYKVVLESLSIIVERSSSDVHRLLKLMGYLIENDVLDHQAYEKGVEEFMEFAEDFAIDVPLLFNHLAVFIAHAVSQKVLTLDYFVTSPAVKSMRASGAAAKLFGKTIKSLRDTKEADEVKALITFDVKALLRPGQNSEEGLKTFYEGAEIAFLLN